MSPRSPIRFAFITLTTFLFCIGLLSAAPLRIMPIGDDLVKENPGFRGPLLAALAAAGHEVEFIGPFSDDLSRHAGFGGFTIGPGASLADGWTNGKGNIYAQLDELLAGPKPDIILLSIGSLDYFNVKELDPGYDVERDGPARLAGVLDRIHALSPGSRVIFANLLPVAWDQYFGVEFNRKLPALAAARPFARLADLHQNAALVNGDWTPQNHLAESGYAKLASAWFDQVILLVGKPSAPAGARP